MNEGKRIHDEMHAGMGALAYSMGPGGFPALVVVASVIIGGLAFVSYVGKTFGTPLMAGAGAVRSWFGSADGYEQACVYGGAFVALVLFVLPFAALTFRTWRRERAGRRTLMSFPVTASLAGIFMVVAGLCANVPSQTFLAVRTPGGTLSHRASCVAEVPNMLKGLQRIGVMLADCEQYYDVATMDEVCRDPIRRTRPLKYPFLSCEDSARRLTGLANWPVDRTMPSWKAPERIVGPDPILYPVEKPVPATTAQMRAALKAKGIEPLAD